MELFERKPALWVPLGASLESLPRSDSTSAGRGEEGSSASWGAVWAPPALPPSCLPPSCLPSEHHPERHRSSILSRGLTVSFMFHFSQARWKFLFGMHTVAFQCVPFGAHVVVYRHLAGFPAAQRLTRCVPGTALGTPCPLSGDLCSGCWKRPGAWRSGSNQRLPFILWRADRHESAGDEVV